MIIGIDGLAGAGKDTVADILVKEGFTKVSFADALRKSVSESFEIPLDTFLDRSTKDKPFNQPLILNGKDLSEFCINTRFENKTDEVIIKFSGIEIESPRRLLQFMGTEIGRETLSPTIWIDAYRQTIQSLGLVVTPDARFENERQLIKQLNGKVFYIHKEGLEASENHKSGNDKWPLDKYDVLVYNDKSIKELQYGIKLWWSMNGKYK